MSAGSTAAVTYFILSIDSNRVEREKRIRLLNEKAASLSSISQTKPMQWDEFQRAAQSEGNTLLKDTAVGGLIGSAMSTVLLAGAAISGIAITPLGVVGLLALGASFVGGLSAYSSVKDKQPQRHVEAYDRYLSKFEQEMSREPVISIQYTPGKHAERVTEQRLNKTVTISQAR
jgi:hypothetical protein